MPIYADFNRDGTLSASPSDRQRALDRPGAILLPNLNADTVPVTGSSLRQGRARLDRDLGVVGATERDLTQIQVVVDAPGATGGILALRDRDRRAVRVYDSSGAIVLGIGASDDPLTHAFPANPTPQTYRVEGVEVPGFPDGRLRGEIRLTLLSIDGSGMEVAPRDEVILTIAPFLLADNAAAPEVLYISQGENNEPSLRDVFRAFDVAWTTLPTTVSRHRGRRIRCELVVVPENLSGKDSWMQDQFEVGWFAAPHRTLRAVLHLPRLRSNFVAVQAGANLSGFVAQHFPRQGIGLIQELWNPDIQVFRPDGQTVRLSHHAVFEIGSIIERAQSAYNAMRRVERFQNASPTLLEGEDRPAILGVPAGVAVRALTDRAATALASPGQPPRNVDRGEYTDRLNALKGLLRRHQAALGQDITITPPTGDTYRLDVTTRSEGTIRFEEQRDAAEQIIAFGGPAGPARSLSQMEAQFDTLMGSHNYGGNIEVSPPAPAAPFGLTFVGSPDLGNTKLWSFLASQGYQPLVPVRTDWLSVGHVDEILSFAPVRGRRDDFVALRASPALALDILLRARDLYQSGLSTSPESPRLRDETEERRIPWAYRDAIGGAHPVTRMLRGKHWLYLPAERGGSSDLEPPRLFQRLMYEYRAIQRQGSATRVRFDGRRTYDASISIREFLAKGRRYNLRVEDDYLAQRLIDEIAEEALLPEEEQPTNIPPLEEVLIGRIPDLDILPLPVLFDLPTAGTTIAYTPNVINMQYLGTHVLVPKPYGPRMSPDDVSQVLRPLLPQGLQGFANRPYFRRHRLDRVYHWAQSDPALLRRDDARALARRFRDGFPESMDLEEIRRRIRNHRDNRGIFHRDTRATRDTRESRGQLRDGLHRLRIPEDTVDLFEAYVYIVLKERCGLRPHFVDSWSYHLHSGQIHCGTNVIRRPPRSPHWWDRSQRIPDEPY